MLRQQLDTGPIYFPIMTVKELFGGIISVDWIDRAGMGGLEKRLDYRAYH
jgi:hypothetical protein